MLDTFGRKLLKFANTADILERENFGKIQNYIKSYLSEVLQIKYVRLMLMLETVGGQIMLTKYSLNKDEQTLLLIKNEEGSYNGQMAYAFDKNKRLWITAENPEEYLDEPESGYIDHWSNTKEIPTYKKIAEENTIKTSIIIPIKRNNKLDNNHIFGVVNFKSEAYLKPNQHAKEELEKISFTLGKLFQLYEARNFQKSNTAAGIDDLAEDLNELKRTYKNYFFDRKPKIFFAFSQRADRGVTGKIKEVIENDLSDQLELIHWDHNQNVGLITKQLLENMDNAEYLICYLSEKQTDAMIYSDNPNVLIELGFFVGQSLNNSYLRNILIIREENSDKALPFDIKDLQTLSVPRFNQTQELNSDSLTDNLKSKLEGMLLNPMK